MIPPAEISRMAHRLGLGDKTIEKDYVLTWVLHAVAASPPLHGLLAFKGGTAIKKMYVPDYRFSEDLDFTMLDTKGTNAELRAAVEGLFLWLAREANLTLATQKVEEHSSGNPTIYLNYIGPLQASLASRSLKVDFSRDETLAFPTEERPVQSPYSDCQARRATLFVYSMEEILAEKLRSLLSRTEPRDLYDVHFLLTNRMADVEQLSFNAAPKFEAKGLATGDLKTVLERRRATFKQLWRTRLSGQMPETPDLDDVIRETNRVLQRYF